MTYSGSKLVVQYSNPIMHPRTLTALALLIAPALAAASEYSDLDFALQLSQADLRLRYAGIDHDSTVERIGVSALNTANRHLHYGFLVGSSRLTLDRDPLLAGLRLDGYHAGLVLRSGLGENPRLEILAQYLYQDVKDSTASREVTITWHEWRGELLAKVALAAPLTAVAGLAYVNVDAQQRITGDDARTLNLREETGMEKRLGLELNVKDSVNNKGRVGIHIQRGVFDSVSLIFARSF